MRTPQTSTNGIADQAVVGLLAAKDKDTRESPGGHVAACQSQPNKWYVAAGSGIVWKTTNAGTTWSPVFDDYGSYSIGCVTIDPSNHNVIWIGTGEDAGGRHVGYGDGVYKSLDRGKSFSNMGLKETENMAKVLVDPRYSNVVYVAAQGRLWSADGESWSKMSDYISGGTGPHY